MVHWTSTVGTGWKYRSSPYPGPQARIYSELRGRFLQAALISLLRRLAAFCRRPGCPVSCSRRAASTRRRFKCRSQHFAVDGFRGTRSEADTAAVTGSTPFRSPSSAFYLPLTSLICARLCVPLCVSVCLSLRAGASLCASVCPSHFELCRS